jgi:hypothetical protein
MKKLAAYFIISIVLISTAEFSQLIAQSEVIPWIPLSLDASANIVERNKTVITTSEINLPVYPGAFLTSYYPISKSAGIDSLELPLPAIFLVTSDDIETVKQYYKKMLKESDGWISQEDYSVFVKGTLSQAFARTAPGIAIREETGESYDLAGADPKIVSSLKTRIKILYKP